jgi:hypothetical protein
MVLAVAAVHGEVFPGATGFCVECGEFMLVLVD